MCGDCRDPRLERGLRLTLSLPDWQRTNHLHIAEAVHQLPGPLAADERGLEPRPACLPPYRRVFRRFTVMKSNGSSGNVDWRYVKVEKFRRVGKGDDKVDSRRDRDDLVRDHGGSARADGASRSWEGGEPDGFCRELERDAVRQWVREGRFASFGREAGKRRGPGLPPDVDGARGGEDDRVIPSRFNGHDRVDTRAPRAIRVDDPAATNCKSE